jgi:hypothetical protein
MFLAECEPVALSSERRDQVIEAICTPDWQTDYVTRAIQVVREILPADEHAATEVVVSLYRDGVIELRPRREPCDSADHSDITACQAKWFRRMS